LDFPDNRRRVLPFVPESDMLRPATEASLLDMNPAGANRPDDSVSRRRCLAISVQVIYCSTFNPEVAGRWAH
jgi:hypothetical protein